jgi:hypothetical protein
MSTWVNGRAGTRIDHRDRGFNYGDGVFETMRVRRRGVRFLDYHLERLDEGCRRLGFAGPSPRVLRRELNAAAARRVDGVLKLVVTRGVGERGYRPTGQERCTRVLSLHPLVKSATDGPRAAARLCDLRLGVNPAAGGAQDAQSSGVRAGAGGVAGSGDLGRIVARHGWVPRLWHHVELVLEERVCLDDTQARSLRRGRRDAPLGAGNRRQAEAAGARKAGALE